MNNRGRWRIGAMASAIALLGSMASLEAHALALGRITVQSALGESLRAEIDISDLNAEETASLRVGVAAADTFKAAGLDYTSAASGLDVKLQRRADGRSFLRLSSNRAITDPFVDFILEAKWSSGRITRDYTMLFDPPNLRANNSAIMATPTAPALSRAPAPSAGLPAREITPTPYSQPAARSAAVAKAPAIKIPPAERIPAGARQVTVKAGDNASKIAAQNKPASVSLDQMLVALLRNNPDAFIGGNINVIKSGAVLDIPDAQAANVLSAGEATQTLIAQSKDFNTFRRKLAQGVPATQIDSADRQLGGKVQARVEDRAQVNTPPDKLTLSKGAVQGKPATAAEEQAAKEAASRVAELSKNISDLNKLGASPVTNPATAAPGLVAPAPGASTAANSAAITATPALSVASASTPGADTSASVTSPAQMPLTAASAPEPAASATAFPAPAPIKPPVLIASPQSEHGVIDQMRDNSLLLGAGALLALLAGFGFARYRKNKKMGQVDSSFLDSRLQPDSFFGASGGRRIDTSESIAGGSSMTYSPSQLDAAGDVDPVAEADVYLAYGRDQQAEEILREAMRTHPARLAIYAKLLEIYAKRRDNKAFESLALTAFKLSKGRGPEWSYINELGRDLDPANSIYQQDAGLADSGFENRVSNFTPVSAVAPLNFPVMEPAGTKPMDLDLDLDLDLDFSRYEVPHSSTIPSAITASVPTNAPKIASSGIAMPSAILNLDELDLDLNLDNISTAQAILTSFSASSPYPLSKESSHDTDFPSEGLDFTPEPFAIPPASIAPAAPVNHSGMLEFDLSSLSLDLGPTTQPPTLALTEPEEDPLEIKFLLAEEFRILGDSDGARSLADEVLTKARGPLKVKVQAFLNTLS